MDGRRKLKCNAMPTIFPTVQPVEDKEDKENSYTVRVFILKLIFFEYRENLQNNYCLIDEPP